MDLDRIYVLKAMRMRRMSYADISKLVGLSRQRVHELIKAYDRMLQEHTRKRGPFGVVIPIWKTHGTFHPDIYTLRRRFGTSEAALREMVRVRDDHRCQVCFRKWSERSGERRFSVHHLDSAVEGLPSVGRRDMNAVFDRMITLCAQCHRQADSVRAKVDASSAHKLFRTRRKPTDGITY